MENINKALRLKTELDALRPLKKDDELRIMQKFRLDWNYHSNKIEGNTLTYGETKALLLFGITAQGKPLKDHIEIRGHNEAIKWVLDIIKEKRPITENFIRELHTLVLKEPYKKRAKTPDGKIVARTIQIGVYKTSPNHVETATGEIFRFATPEETPAKMNDLVQWYRQQTEKETVNAILLATEFHYKFIRIHPFDDGNGRTARILMNFILMKYGFPPVIIKTEDKENYYAALRQADAGIFEPFLDYIAANLVYSLELMISGAKGESIEEPDDISKEIKLLEQRLKSVGTRIKIGKNKDTVYDIYNKIIEKLKTRFIGKSDLFKNFYVKSGYNFHIDNKKRDHLNYGLRNMERFSYYIVDLVVIQYFYQGFNQSGFNEFDYYSSISIQFKHTKYIASNSNKTAVFEKYYDEYLTDLEMDELINSEIRLHKEFIETKIKEVQNH